MHSKDDAHHLPAGRKGKFKRNSAFHSRLRRSHFRAFVHTRARRHANKPQLRPKQENERRFLISGYDEGTMEGNAEVINGDFVAFTRRFTWIGARKQTLPRRVAPKKTFQKARDYKKKYD